MTPEASVSAFSTDKNLAAHVDSLDGSELRLVMRPDPYVPSNVRVSPCEDRTGPSIR